VTSPIDALRAVHEALWDDRVGLVRLAPGVVPGVDLAALDLHSVRETALGAFLDLQEGRTGRAQQALRAVLANQYRVEGAPWSGTFKVTAEEADPPGDGAVEWLHYDPNWRQFLGCILALVVEVHRTALDPDLTAELEAAVDRCVAGEPPDRIPRWYTNPNLMHAWLTAWRGAGRGDAALVADGTARARRIVARFDRHGDLDEYNSPTYDGVDLFALALWVALPPDEVFAAEGARVVERLAGRMSHLFHPGLHVGCGPYIRAYGLSMRRYVSLAGLWLHLAGVDDAVLPPVLDAGTVHVHDLYFLPVFAHLHARVPMALTRRPVEARRTLVQSFGDVVATSVLEPDACLGFEHGRRPGFAGDQYVPVVGYAADGSSTGFVALMVGEATARIDGVARGERATAVTVSGVDGVTDVVVAVSAEPAITGGGMHLGPLHLSWAGSPEVVRLPPTEDHLRFRLRWAAGSAVMGLSVAGGD
jgi:hypothetical protein